MAHEILEPGHYHHWEPEQAYHGSKLGMWIFLATEVHLFSALFCMFGVFRWKYLHEFNQAAQSLNWKLGGLNTVVLLASSYFMVRAVDAAQKGLNKKVITYLDITFVLACVFLVVKLCFEYPAKFSHGIYPWTNIFFGLYFTATAIHGLHVVIGMGVIIWLRILAKKERFSVTYYTPVEVTGLYWHLVDVVWIFLFPIFYLLGGMPTSGH